MAVALPVIIYRLTFLRTSIVKLPIPALPPLGQDYQLRGVGALRPHPLWAIKGSAHAQIWQHVLATAAVSEAVSCLQ